LVTNTANGKQYVGQTCKGFDKRWIKHLDCARRGLGHKFPNAIRKYGKDGFTHEILATSETVEWSNYLERMWILLLDAVKKGYNTTEGGEGFRGDLNPNRLNPRRGKDSPSFGRIVPLEQRERISKSLMGRYPGEKNPFFGRTHTPEMIEFYKTSQKGKTTKPCSPETKEKISKSQIGMIFTEERRQNMRAAKLGTTQSEEQKANSVISQKVRRERELSMKYAIRIEEGIYSVHHAKTGVKVSGPDRKKVLETANRKVKAALDPNRVRRGSPEHKIKLAIAAQKRREREREKKAA